MNVTEQFNLNDCPICMDTFEGTCNKVVTECGHAFHCSCLMQNIAHNGFGCPYCRVKMADTKEDELGCWQDDDEDEDEEISVISSVFGDDVLATFRMFHQQLNGEEVEEDDEEDEDEETSEDEDEHFIMPDPSYIKQKLLERGITMEDLIKENLYREHNIWRGIYNEFEHSYTEIYGQIRTVIIGYTRHQRPQPQPRILNIAEAKPERIDDYKYF